MIGRGCWEGGDNHMHSTLHCSEHFHVCDLFPEPCNCSVMKGGGRDWLFIFTEEEIEY